MDSGAERPSRRGALKVLGGAAAAVSIGPDAAGAKPTRRDPPAPDVSIGKGFNDLQVVREWKVHELIEVLEKELAKTQSDERATTLFEWFFETYAKFLGYEPNERTTELDDLALAHFIGGIIESMGEAVSKKKPLDAKRYEVLMRAVHLNWQRLSPLVPYSIGQQERGQPDTPRPE